MAREERNPREREPSGNTTENTAGYEVEARKRTTIADDLGNRASGRLKQDAGRQHESPIVTSSDAVRAKRRARRFRDGQDAGINADTGGDIGLEHPGETGGSGGNARSPNGDAEPSPAERAADGISARKEATLADELGVESSGRLKQGSSRQHDGAKPDGSAPTRTRGKRFREQSSRLRAEADLETDGVGSIAGKGDSKDGERRLKASKGARHALRFAEDAGAVANASVFDEDDRDVSEDAVEEAGRRIRPYGRRALDRARRRKGAVAAKGVSGAAASAGPEASGAAGTARLRDGPAFATKAGGKASTAEKAAGNASGGNRLSNRWKCRTWKRTARTEAAARKAAATGEAGTLKGLAALKARLRRMFTAGGGGRTAVAIVAAVVLLAMFAMSALSTCTTVATGVVQAAAATSYTADDREIKDADAAYTQMEAALEGQAQAAGSSHPGYDEYRYQIGELGHDPYALASMLTARYGAYRASEVMGFLQEILDAQYDLTFEESTETEYTTVIDEATGETSTQETTRRILTVRLVNHGLDHAARQLLTADELASYEATYACKGNRDDLFPAPYAGNYGSTGAGFDWQPPGEALSDAKFAAMYNEGKKYLGWPYVWGGGSPETGFDCSGYVSWVLTASGVCNTGRQITDGLLSFCSQVSREQARPGDLVFFTGTYETDLKTSHVGIYLGDGMMMHCGDPIQITSIDTPYWQAHLYGFGRVRSS